jgi:hypothetical protein
MSYSDEPPTKPDNATDPAALMIGRLFGELAPIDRRRLARLVEAWFTATLEQRILIESIAFEFAKPR